MRFERFAILLMAGVAWAAEVHTVTPDIRVTQLAAGVWWHVSYQEMPSFGRVGANGMIVVSGDRVVMVDMPWNDKQTGQLCDWIGERFGSTLTDVVATHSHADCMGGLEEAHRRGARSYACQLTGRFARDVGGPVPQILFDDRLRLSLGELTLELWFPGGGHTRDNIVAWVPERKVLFGGCLVKRSGAGMGNTSDADLDGWPLSIRHVMAAYSSVRRVIPGHGPPGGFDYLRYTHQLVGSGVD